MLKELKQMTTKSPAKDKGGTLATYTVEKSNPLTKKECVSRGEKLFKGYQKPSND